MHFHVYNPNYIEPWDWRALGIGIGGSETSAIEMSKRLVRRGFEVTCYSKMPDDCPDQEYCGVHWRDLADADMTAPGIWVIYRNLHCMDAFTCSPDHRAWLICQDVDYVGWTEERAKKFERIVSLCPVHCNYLQTAHPLDAERVVLGSNGIPSDTIQTLPTEQRNPRRLIYSSSPDRALAELLWIFKRAREIVPDLELAIYYGLDNINKLTNSASDNKFWQGTRETVALAQRTPGVTWHGRIGQVALWREYLRSGLWVYPTWFSETSCITCMEAQALGAVPITRPYWALRDNVKHGVFIDGPVNDLVVRSRYVDAVCRLATSEAVETLRTQMRIDALQRYDWENEVDRWICWALGDYPWLGFQRENSTGMVLNVGAGGDTGNLKHACQAWNVDVCTVDPVSKLPNAIDELADARHLPYTDDEFDTVVLGEVLEHLLPEERQQALDEAFRVAKRVVVTIPCDERSLDEQRLERSQIPCADVAAEWYAAGCSTYHTPFSEADLYTAVSERRIIKRQRFNRTAVGLVLER